MPGLELFDYAVVRVVPRVERGEFINAGVIVSCPALGYLKAKVGLDERRLAALDPTLDPSFVREHLRAVVAVCEGGEGAGPVGLLPPRSRFHWLVAPRSTVIQTSPAHTGLCDDGERMLERLFDRMVSPPRA